jgi:uncharacterized protein (TIGR03083 family)
MNGSDVVTAVDESVRRLRPYTSQDWSRPAGRLDWSCWTTAAHLAHDLLAYAAQVAGRPTEAYLPLDLNLRPGTPPDAVLDVIVACGRLLSAILNASGSSARAWHWGPTDPGGFAALGVTETLVHTWDIAQGLGINGRPSTVLSAAVLDRLFPNAPAGDPADVLLWCTGRIALPDHPRLESWVLKAARPAPLPPRS